MPDTPDRPTRHHRTTGVDLLDRALDAAAGRATAAPGDSLDPEMAATIDTLWTTHARSTPPGPDAAFVARLREDLMHASPLPLPVPAQPHRRDTNARPSRSRLPFAAWATSGVGAFPTILTIGVAIALIVASVGWWDRAGTPPAPTPSEVAFAAATPPPSSTIALSMSDTGFSPAVLDVPAGTPATVTLAITNAGSRIYRFRIPALGVSADIPAGETRAVEVTLSPGVFAFFAADSTAIGDGLHGQLTVPVGIGEPMRQGLETTNPDATLWSNATVTMKARPTSDGRPLGTYPAGMGFHPVSISGGTFGDSEATVTWMRWTLVSLPGTNEIGWIETGHLTATKPTYALSTPIIATPAAAIDVPPVSTAGGPGRSWRLSDTDPRTDGLPRQIAADANVAVTSALVVGDSIVVSGTNTTSQYGMGEIRRIDLRTGETLWRAPAKPWGMLAAGGNLVYSFTLDAKKVATPRPRVSAFSLSTGEEVWTGNELGGLSDAPFNYGPILMDGMLFATDAYGNTIALDPMSGATQWQYPETITTDSVTDAPSSSMIGADGAIIVAMADHRLVRLDAATGVVETESTLDPASIQTNLLHTSGGFIIAQITTSVDGSVQTVVRLIEAKALTAIAANAPITRPSSSTIAEPAGPMLAIVQTSSGAILERFFATESASGLPALTVDADTRPSFSLISMAGDTVMQLGGDGELTFIDTASGESHRADIPVAVPNSTTELPPLLWGDAPVIVAGDGTIWALDGPAEPETTGQTPGVLTFSDDGFDQVSYSVRANAEGFVSVTLVNRGGEPHTILIPALGVDATIPSGAQLTMTRAASPGVVAVLALAGTATRPDVEFTTALAMDISGTAVPSVERPVTVGVSKIDAAYETLDGTEVYVRPDPASQRMEWIEPGQRIWPLGPEGLAATPIVVIGSDGQEWTLITRGTIGWVPSSSLSPLDSDQTLLPPATPDASSPMEGT